MADGEFEDYGDQLDEQPSPSGFCGLVRSCNPGGNKQLQPTPVSDIICFTTLILQLNFICWNLKPQIESELFALSLDHSFAPVGYAGDSNIYGSGFGDTAGPPRGFCGLGSLVPGMQRYKGPVSFQYPRQ